MNKLKNTRIVVTGGGGFIGSHIVERLLREDVKEVVIFDNFGNSSISNLNNVFKDKRVSLYKNADVLDIKKIQKAVRRSDFIFHMSALKDKTSPKKALLLFETNVIGTLNVLKAAVGHGTRKIIFASSIRAYGMDYKKPVKENFELKDRSLYGISKIIGEKLCASFYHNFSLPYIALRYAFVYGPRLYAGNYRQQAFVSKTLDRIKRGQPPLIYGNGSQAYDCIYIDDAVEATISALKSDRENAVYNVGTGVPTSVNKLLKTIIEETGRKIRPRYQKRDNTHGTYRVENSEKIYKELGFRYKIRLNEGIRRVMEWMNF